VLLPQLLSRFRAINDTFFMMIAPRQEADEQYKQYCCCRCLNDVHSLKVINGFVAKLLIFVFVVLIVFIFVRVISFFLIVRAHMEKMEKMENMKII